MVFGGGIIPEADIPELETARASRRSSRRARPPQSIVEWVRANVATAGAPDKRHRPESGIRERPDAPLTRPASLCTMPRRHPSTDRASAVFRRRASLSAPTPDSTTALTPGLRGWCEIGQKAFRDCARTAHRAPARCARGAARSLGCGRRPVSFARQASTHFTLAAARRRAAETWTGRAIVDLYEYQGRDLFERHGLPVLAGGVADDPGGGPRDRRAPRRPGGRQGPGEGRRPGQGRRRQARRRTPTRRWPGDRHPRAWTSRATPSTR